ncbi:MAG: hypothetical protein M3R54_13310 [Chloroflexota bacterium]|nr:hypothetical protein [Chloroflexota bacterium]
MMRISPLAVLVAAVFGALATLQPVGDSDLFWHLDNGRRTLAGDLPRTDVLSWTVAGAPVFTDQWLGDVLLAIAKTLGDWRGVLALRVIGVVALVLIVVDTAMAARPGRPIVAVVAALPAIALSRFAWTDRPELLGWVCFALLVRLLRGGDRALLFTIPLLLVWSQLHGSYALGLGLILASCGARAIKNERERWQYVPIAAFAFVVTLWTPAGIGTWTAPGFHFFSPPRFIQEWALVDARTLPGVLFLGTLCLLIATGMLGTRTTLRDAALLIPVAFISLTAARHMPFLAIAAAPYFASRWPDPLARMRVRDDARPTETLSRRVAGSSLIVAAALAVLAVAVGLADAKIDESGYPKGALGALPSGPGLFNQYDWGGWLIYASPKTPTFIDGRLVPFVPGVLDDYRSIISARPDWEDVVSRRGVTMMLVRPSDPIATRAPERGWRVAYRDALALVLAK